MRVVIALGGNALQRRGEAADLAHQRHNLALAAKAVAQIAERHEVIVCHGNGPQVGWLAMQTSQAGASPAYPLDVLDAGSEGMIGYLIEQELENRLAGRPVATLLTQVEVDPADPAFRNPDKPIGPVLPEAEALRLTGRFGWRFAREGNGWRRMVASPKPQRILEMAAIRQLAAAGTLVVCAGGGGIPVAVDGRNSMHGVEAVIDKDRTAALLARELSADALLLLTDVDAVYRDWGTASACAIGEITPAELAVLTFAPGSMAAKVEAACRFVLDGGRLAGIGRLEDAADILDGRAGTRVARPQDSNQARR
ncbi:MAG: carbamate kinase [Thiobacillus sp.]|nr:carbamate kinase [Thiobacillus sp.]